ncbi:AMP-binding protein [Aquibaculum arenosum]|uniref:AMP-binding protein n=1 Tax=Aquibaculum arenosum TaxID=3032591 RepID=A0ABT5YS92_9PROT|nr:AMP-binding protein [Fodinicurvata sp. CAU 1616]MDF2097104.1 AMP-binding protein [Fodinicurvata sp. CAU 1616]
MSTTNLPPESLDTFPKLLAHHVEVRGDRPAMREKDYGIWQTSTWKEVAAEVRDFACGLAALGLQRGERVAIVGDNRPRLYWAMTAAQALGCVPVPLYQDSVAEEMAFVLDHAEARFAVVEDQEQVDKLLDLKERCRTLETIIYDDPRGLRNYDQPFLHDYEAVQKEGQTFLKSHPDFYEQAVAAGRGSDISVILYTSGTTGRSKGVVLTAAGCINAARDTVAFDHLNDRDQVLAYLPPAWVGDHYLNYAQGLVAGFCMACPESADTVEQDLREIGPTFYFAPPRVFENLLTRVMIRMEDAGRMKRALFHHFIALAKRHGEKILNGEKVPLPARLHYALGELLIYGPLKNVLGFSNIRVAYTAGEAIGPDLFSFYRSIGLNLKQLYGQTEAFLYVTAQPDGAIFADTVGPAIPNVDIRIEEGGEVLFKSPGQFQGYYKDDENTAEALTPDGYVRTGDAGFFDEATGHLKIIDRAKDVGRMQDGSLFAPKYVENKLKFFPFIKEAVVFGHERPFATAFINIDMEAVGNWAERNSIQYGSYQELAALPQIYAVIGENVEQVNRDLAQDSKLAGSQVRRFLVLHKELDADDGELTRTRKVRRRIVNERYAELIAALYDGRTEVHASVEVTFEDGRKGRLDGDLTIADVETFPPVQPAIRQAAE